MDAETIAKQDWDPSFILINFNGHEWGEDNFWMCLCVTLQKLHTHYLNKNNSTFA